MVTQYVKQVLKNPTRILYRFRDQLLKRNNIDSLIDFPIRFYSSKIQKPRIMMAITRFDYGDISRGVSFEENNFLHSIVQSGYEVIVFDTLGTVRKYGIKMMNDLLVENVYRWNPDVVFFFLFRDEIHIDTLKRLRDDICIPTLNWFADDHWRFETFSKKYAPQFSYIVTTDKEAIQRYEDIGVKNAIYSQWACNHYLYRRISVLHDKDVTFIGQPHGDRKKIIKKIAESNVEVSAYGFGWPNGRLSTYQMIEMFNRTKINLNLSNSSRGRRDQIKGRDFEIPGCGGFMLRPQNSQISEYFLIGKELILYSTIEDLTEKIHYYLDHDDDRNEIRNAAYERVLREHTYDIRFERIFNQVLNK